MYAVVEDGGKQFMVRTGQTVFLERRDLPDAAKSLTLDRVLMLGEAEACKIGAPYVAGAKVTATVHGEIKGPKLRIEKFRRRKGYHLRKGHRQRYLKVTIDDIKG
ncbi:MAG: 50S ribosomal protein L21 [Phycisphaerae bacterium]|nr:50S ribosomal protein L21 [Phycisphaerae bacterium]